MPGEGVVSEYRGSKTKEEESPSYPGLGTSYRIHAVAAKLAAWEGGEDFTTRDAKGGEHYYSWRQPAVRPVLGPTEFIKSVAE